jgi:prepilin signal peptidase PulO-like enzyme (type II secretory pathway)
MVLFSISIFVFGLTIGSFLNCVIYRLEVGENIGGRSYCPNCKHTLAWQDLIPVLSFVFLKGKCRYCKEKISWQYPLVEISTALIFLQIYNFSRLWRDPVFNMDFINSAAGQFSIFNFQTILNLVYLWVVASLLIIIFVFDLKHYIIPDKILLPAIAIALIFNFSAQGGPASGWQFLISAIGATAFFSIIYFISRGAWMGLGDVKLTFFMGLFLGFPNILAALFLAFFLGAIMGIGLMALKIKELKSQVPFGPFLIAGTFLALFWGQEIISWYLNFAGIG